MAEEALDLRMAWAIRCLVRYPRELSVKLSFVIFMSFLDPCIGLYNSFYQNNHLCIE